MEQERRRAQHDGLALAEFRADAERKILPALAHVRLDQEIVTLLHAYLGTGPFRDDAVLMPRSQLATLPGLRRPNLHAALCRKLVWALCDPEAPAWLDPSFYVSTSTA